jgi:mutual gliding-motility protein MglA
MPLVDHAQRRITVKLVLCGTGGAGKTTSLMWLHANVPARSVGSLTSIATRHDRTLFFDFVPIDAGRVGAYDIAVHLYTVPGQPRYRDARQSVLRGADGIAHVIDSQRDRLEDNHESLREVHLALAEHGVESRALPTVMHFNKRDLDPSLLLTPAELSAALNFRGVPEYLTDAVRGPGLVDALRGLNALVLQRLGAPAAAPVPAPPGGSATPSDAYAILPVIATPPLVTRHPTAPGGASAVLPVSS